MVSAYRLHKTFLREVIEQLPDTLHEESGILFYLDENRESIDVGRLQPDGSVDLSFPIWALTRKLNMVRFRHGVVFFDDGRWQAEVDGEAYHISYWPHGVLCLGRDENRKAEVLLFKGKAHFSRFL